nr:hypothetical protein [uncultured Pseudomonas sp.]
MEQVSETITAQLCELVEARYEAAIFFQLAERALDDMALSLFGPVERSGQIRLSYQKQRETKRNVCVIVRHASSTATGFLIPSGISRLGA